MCQKKFSIELQVFQNEPDIEPVATFDLS